MKFAKCFIIINYVLIGCLAPDPQLEVDKSQDSGAQVEQNTLKISVPLEIDPEILANRTFGEAPMLAEWVRKGELPPVSERLPDIPLVVVPMEEIGRYGGILRRALTGDVVQTPGVNKTLGENLMAYKRPVPDLILYNLAEHYEFQDDGRIALFKLREGVRWSDGMPFTVDDILFWYNDMTCNDDARSRPLFPSNFLVEGKRIEMDKVSDYTLRVRSHKPLGRVFDLMCDYRIAYPKHILAFLHPDYNPNATYETFRDSTTRAQLLMNPRIPRLSAWYPVEWVRGQRIVYERNPYYFKVDSAGNQLPYADQLVFNIIPDPRVILLKFMNNEIDLFGRYAQVNMYTMLKNAEKDGAFKLQFAAPTPASVLYINWDAPRLPLRRALRNKRIRMALSHGINREEINQLVRRNENLLPFILALTGGGFFAEGQQIRLCLVPSISGRFGKPRGLGDAGSGVLPGRPLLCTFGQVGYESIGQVGCRPSNSEGKGCRL